MVPSRALDEQPQRFQLIDGCPENATESLYPIQRHRIGFMIFTKRASLMTETGGAGLHRAARELRRARSNGGTMSESAAVTHAVQQPGTEYVGYHRLSQSLQLTW